MHGLSRRKSGMHENEWAGIKSWEKEKKLSFQSKLINCPKCHCAAYCGPSHLQEDAENHALSCSSLEICLRDYVREARNPVEFARFQNDFKPVVVSAEYRPLPKSIEEVFSCDDETHLRAFTFNYTCQLTVLFGLEKFYSAPRKRYIRCKVFSP